MTGKRFYIYRFGSSDSCAVTAIKNETRLRNLPCPADWRFWKQITNHTIEQNRNGFNFDAAASDIAAKG